jgi:hypothetical protein
MASNPDPKMLRSDRIDKFALNVFRKRLDDQELCQGVQRSSAGNVLDLRLDPDKSDVMLRGIGNLHLGAILTAVKRSIPGSISERVLYLYFYFA